MMSFKKVLRGLAIMAAPAAAIALTATPAQATLPTVVFTCDAGLTSPDAAACAGYYTGNLLNGSAADIQNQKDALALLGFTWGGDWTALESSTSPDLVLTKEDVGGGLSGPNKDQLNFGTTLSGLTIIGAHFGNVYGDAGNVSVFWLFNLLTPTDHITLDHKEGWSNAALYTTGQRAVPEPATWAMMLFGMGAAGVAMRRGRKARPMAQIA